MPNQLHHIADEATTNELITVRLIPFSSGEHAGLSAFTVLGFSNVVPDMVYLDPGRADLARLTGEDPQVAEYAANFETLFDLAMSEAESIAFIRAVADKMSGQAVLLR
jgi:hypothetical protein